MGVSARPQMSRAAIIGKGTAVVLAAVMMVAMVAGCGDDPEPASEKPPDESPGSSDVGPTTTEFDVGLNAEVAAWQLCAKDPEQVYLDAGTDDPLAAAEYVAEVSTGPYQDDSVRGCLAGLGGDPPPAEKCTQQPSFYGCSLDAAPTESVTTAATAESTAPTTFAGERTVVYEATGTAGTAHISYAAGVDLTTVEDALLPQRYETTVAEASPLPMITVTVIDYEFTGSVSCRITIDGVVVAQDTGEGLSPDAFCTGAPP